MMCSIIAIVMRVQNLRYYYPLINGRNEPQNPNNRHVLQEKNWHRTKVTGVGMTHTTVSKPFFLLLLYCKVNVLQL
jgi:hypothetical protein